MKKTIVVSAVNLVEAGTLTILRDCLSYLSTLARDPAYRIVAIVHDKDLAYFEHIEYIETRWPKKRWINRLWYEYVSLKRISKQIGLIDLWLSLHDTTPSVTAKRRAVYCHNTYAFYKRKMHDWVFSPKIAMISFFTKWIYRTNIQKNTFLVVQQAWFRKAMADMFEYDEQRIILAPPKHEITVPTSLPAEESDHIFHFVYAASPNSHKNFETLLGAAAYLESKGITNFLVHITVNGTENAYANWLYKKWAHLKSVDFHGFVDRESLFKLYRKSDCLVYPSKIESWGLPISEFALYGKPMLLADLPYAHETASGHQKTAFFEPENTVMLAKRMEELILEDTRALKSVESQELLEPFAPNWQVLFKKLLNE
ncbi:glycosyltransferase [Sphingobacterium corticis]|uniref:Glycosyltransferase n=1 Tax=Sphingobacterium corticis TaxID=1812823 RepID=A0ABW5NK91_9SPHI